MKSVWIKMGEVNLDFLVLYYEVLMLCYLRGGKIV